MVERIQKSPHQFLDHAVKTIIAGTEASRNMRKATESLFGQGALVSPEDAQRLVRDEKEQFMKSFDFAVNKARENLAVVDRYRERIGGRQGAEEFLRDLIDLNPGQFFISYEERQMLSELSERVFQTYLEENKTTADQLTLEQGQEINDRIMQAMREHPELKNASFTLEPDRNDEIKKAHLRRYMEEPNFSALRVYQANLASKLFPTLEKLFKEGKIRAGVPLYLVQPGNNDIRNTMHVSLVKDLVHEFLSQHGLQNQVPIEVHILGLGGHPTTAAFVAHIEVMTSKERCEFLKTKNPEVVKPALLQAAKKLSPKDEAQVLDILEKMDYKDALQELLACDATRPVFSKLGNLIDGSEKIPLFKGVSEAETHGAFMERSSKPGNYVLKLEPNSKHTGENVQFFVQKIPQGQKPVVLLFDACRTGRQVVTFSNQMVDKSVAKEQNWSAIVSPLIDLPVEQYTQASTEDQLYIDAATLFAELARNIAYRTTCQFVDAVPMKSENYDLLARYYAKMANVTIDNARQTPISQVMKVVGKEFADFENTIPAGHDRARHPKQLERLFHQHQARRLLSHAPMDKLEALVEESVYSGKKQPLQIPIKAIPARVRDKVVDGLIQVRARKLAKEESAK